ncbi:MAG: MCP four helix bundle domain-containing protein [Magnetococcales bacterium]|nr:MCP four helix bundle domain-containing protein [Magnetococcales bacterium]
MPTLFAALEKQTLKVKLVLGFTSLLLIAFGIGLESLYNQRMLNETIQLIYNQELLGLARGKDVQLDYTLIGRTLRQAIIATDAEGRESALKQLSKAREQLPIHINELRARLVREETQVHLASFEEALAIYLQRVDEALQLMNRDQTPEAQTLVASKRFQEIGVEATRRLVEVIRIKEQAAREMAMEAQQIADRALWLTSLLVGSGLMLGMLFGVLVSRAIRQPLDRLRAAVVQLSTGNLDHPVPHAEDPNELGELARAITVLQTGARQMETQRWIKTHSATVSGDLQMAATFSELSQKFFSGVAPLIHLGYGALYRVEEAEQRLYLLGGYAHLELADPQPEIAFGAGLVGQCALEGQAILIHDPPASYLRIRSTLAASVPCTIAILPVQRNKRLLAVLELATLVPHGQAAQTLLDNVLPFLAVSLEILDRSRRTGHLSPPIPTEK